MSTKDYPFVSYERDTYDEEEMIKRSKEFLEWMDTRRSVRDFSDKPVPKEVMENIFNGGFNSPFWSS